MLVVAQNCFRSGVIYAFPVHISIRDCNGYGAIYDFGLMFAYDLSGSMTFFLCAISWSDLTVSTTIRAVILSRQCHTGCAEL